VDAVAVAGSEAIAAARRGEGPTLLWVELDRLTSHTNSDDHRIYRSKAEIALMKERDPVTSYAASLIASGALDEAQVRALQDEATKEADAAYAAAEIEPAPAAASANTKLFGLCDPAGHVPPFELEDSANTMAGALNSTLREVLARIPNAVLLGEDVEDPKGGVFGFTKGLSTRYPGRVVNSALAEGDDCRHGHRPGGNRIPARSWKCSSSTFIAPAFNQLPQSGRDAALAFQWRLDLSRNFLRALRSVPAGRQHLAQPVQRGFLDPHSLACASRCRARLPIWRGLLWSAMQESDPDACCSFPSTSCGVRHEPVAEAGPRLRRARIVQTGSDITVVTWGNCLEVVQKAAAHHAGPLVDRNHRSGEPRAVRPGRRSTHRSRAPGAWWS
jgi:2-oxoisovalerate dehydrogenase E1 component